MDVLDPIPSCIGGPVTPLAPRPRDLRGLRLGVLDNSKPNADALLGRIAEALAQRHGMSIHRWVKPGSSVPARDHDALAAGADVFITGSAD
jgi:hypothetical protein